jgi:uncharacterized lipoprotein YmbA
MKQDIQVRSSTPEVRRLVSCLRCEGEDTSARGGKSGAKLPGRSRLARLLLAVAVSVSLTGCFGFLKPARSTSRHFVLTSLPVPDPATAPRGNTAIGLGQVKLASYLFNSSFAIRRGTNEIDYSSSVLWAERLDSGLQRVLAVDLAILLPTDQLRLSAWENTDVALEVYVAIGQFDIDAKGQSVLGGWWRILSPGGGKTLKAGEIRLTRQGPSPDTDPSGAVATLSELAADLSRQLAEAVKEVAPVSAVPP